jgi:multicomponent Na+:H+ antiporter subunit B
MIFEMTDLIDLSLLLFLAVLAITIARLRNLFAVVIVTGFYSLVSAALFTVLDAVDVAFTEAAVGAGISTVIMLATLLIVGSEEKKSSQPRILPLLAVIVTGACLVFGTLDMPHYGDPDAPIHQHVAPRYIEDSFAEIGVPNIVTSVLASYRGYDTLGETCVIFTAGVAVLMLIGQSLRFRRKDEAA